MRKKMFYVLYNLESELPVCFTDSVEELRNFLGATTANCVYSILSHYFNGDHDKIRDKQGNYYTAARFTEEQLA